MTQNPTSFQTSAMKISSSGHSNANPVQKQKRTAA